MISTILILGLGCSCDAIRRVGKPYTPKLQVDVTEEEFNPHNTHLDLVKTQARFFEHKTLGSLLKVGRKGSSQCLSFLHIPKNAGTTIEDLSTHIVSSTDDSARHWGRLDTSLECEGDRQCTFQYQKEGAPKKATCYKWHVPPYKDQKLAASYLSDGCETFCVVRSPSDRFFSELKYRGGFNCSAEGFHSSALRSIQNTLSDPYHADCHMVPATEYIYGDSHTPQFCKHQLRHENLKEDFDKLMSEFGLPLSLDERNHAFGSSCHIPLETRDADQEVHDFILKHYGDDLKNFHYTK